MSHQRALRLRSHLSRRFMRRLGWAVGAPLAIFRFLRREIPLEEIASTGPPPFPDERVDPADAEKARTVGPVVHRLYSATIQAPKLSAERLLAIIAADPNVIAPVEVLHFEKRRGDRRRLEKGDELLIRMFGPWNGPVQVVRRWQEGFRLAATRGHPQLGQLELRARDDDGQIAMEIQTRERAAGVGFHLLQRIGLVRRMQDYTWGEVLENAAQLAGGRRLDRITVRSWPGTQENESFRAARKRRALAALSHSQLNFDRSRQRDFTRANGWYVDDRRQALPAEPAGPPVPGGTWDVARRLMRGYEFADPSIVRASYDPEASLEGRNMLLELRFWRLRFLVGVRVMEVYDETRTLDGRDAHVWGWSYATLEGHLEMGEMFWEVRKWLDTGEVEFTIHAYSRPADVSNPLIRFGFRLFGRRVQLRFLRMTCERMRRLTEEATRAGTGEDSVRRVAEEVTAGPASGAAAIHEKLVRNLRTGSERD